MEKRLYGNYMSCDITSYAILRLVTWVMLLHYFNVYYLQIMGNLHEKDYILYTHVICVVKETWKIERTLLREK